MAEASALVDWAQTAGGRPLEKRADLVVESLAHVDAEFACAGRHDRVDLGREDEQRNPGFAQHPHPHPVGTVGDHELRAVFAHEHSVVGVHAVEVGDDGVDVDRRQGARCVEGAGEHGCHGELVERVDLDRVPFVDGHDPDGSEEPVARGAEARRAHDVEGAGLPVLRVAVLAARAERVVVVDPGCPVGVEPPQEGVGRHRREHRVAVVVDPGDRLLEGHRVDEGARGLDEDEHARAHPAALEHVERVQQCRLRAGRVGGERRRAVHDVGAGGERGRCDLGVVGGDHDPVDRGGALCAADGAGEERRSADLAEVLAVHALRPASRRNHGDDLGRITHAGLHSRRPGGSQCGDVTAAK